MSSDNLFGAEEDVIALGEKLLANGGFGGAEDKQRYQQLLKNYQKLFRTTRRLMRLCGLRSERIAREATQLHHIARRRSSLDPD
jgi:adenylate cyclase